LMKDDEEEEETEHRLLRLPEMHRELALFIALLV
jgi:hypothetical protein